MQLATVDWIIIIAFLVISLVIGLSLKNKAGKNLSSFFLGGRNLPWYIAGISMVATTFAADTPLWVTEVIAQKGISGNWLWWNMLIGGMLTTFFFAKLWRRANILTELELIELRYSGKPAAFLRGFKSVYMGIFLNAVIIGWVNYALMKILEVFFDIPADDTIWYIAGAMGLVAIYSSISGLLGVAITDTIQFIIAMIGCIILAFIVLNTEKVGGISGLKAQLPAWRFDFFPSLAKGDNSSEAIPTLSLTIGAFLSFGLVQWWASWYPGAEPGGGGYVSQRMMSAKNEKHAVWATLFFQIAHYCLRPWPWIIVGLCALILFPNLPVEEAGKGFVYAMRDYLPAGLKGLLLVAFLGAYMSTISTQLNWGASYLTNDLYKRFMKPQHQFEDEEQAQKHYVLMARVFTVVIMLIALFATTQINTIDSAAKFLISCGAGLGMVLILRWYWWRINAWSEITATIAPFAAYGALKWVEHVKLTALNSLHDGTVPAEVMQQFYLDHPYLDHTGTFLITVGFTTLCWITLTFATAPTKRATLLHFYQRVKPDGAWKPIHAEAKIDKRPSDLLKLTICWVSSIVMVYAVLFLIGKLIFMEWNHALYWGITAAISFVVLRYFLKRTNILSE